MENILLKIYDFYFEGFHVTFMLFILTYILLLSNTSDILSDISCPSNISSDTKSEQLLTSELVFSVASWPYVFWHLIFDSYSREASVLSALKYGSKH